MMNYILHGCVRTRHLSKFREISDNTSEKVQETERNSERERDVVAIKIVGMWPIE